MKPLSSAYFTLILPIIALALLAAGCRREADPALQRADALMEQHPDSALSLLDSYSFKENASDYDRAMHGMLLAHARYKNFIDMGNDSTLRVATEFFIDNKCLKEAARALFLLGMTAKESGQAGEAAVCFLKGMDAARGAAAPVWEAQCARGMCQLYGNMFDASSQLSYAVTEYEAFSKCGLEDWSAYAMLDMASARNNLGEYGKAADMARELIGISRTINDQLLMEESLALLATALHMSGKYRESLENFEAAYKINPGVMTSDRKALASIAASGAGMENLPPHIREFVIGLKSDSSYVDEFSLLAGQGNFREAYLSLDRYRARQDSILAALSENSLSASIRQYEAAKELSRATEIKNEYISIGVAMVMLLLAIGVFYMEAIEKRDRERFALKEKIARLENTIKDLTAPNGIESAAEGTDSEDAIPTLDSVRESYARLNRICDACYQGKENKASLEETRDIISRFTDRNNLDNIGNTIDRATGGLYSAFRRDFYDMTDENLDIFLYMLLGFGPRSIAFILGQPVSAYYNKKSRLKSRVSISCSERKSEYLKVFSR